MNKEKILARVQKMLNLAYDSGATEGERDNALRMAHSTLAKYNLELADVERNVDKKVEPREQHIAQFYGRPWARSVARSVGDLFFCSYLYLSARKATDVRHYFIGRHSNAVTASMMATYIVQSIMKEGKKEQRRLGKNNPWLRAFCWGAAHVIERRVKEIREAAEQESVSEPGTSLVLASVYDQERSQNALWIKEKYPELKTGRRGKGFTDGDAYDKGKTYGDSVSLNVQVGDKRNDH